MILSAKQDRILKQTKHVVKMSGVLVPHILKTLNMAPERKICAKKVRVYSIKYPPKIDH